MQFFYGNGGVKNTFVHHGFQYIMKLKLKRLLKHLLKNMVIKMKQLTDEENKKIIEVVKILKSASIDQNCWLLTFQDFPVKIPKYEDIKTFLYINPKLIK